MTLSIQSQGIPFIVRVVVEGDRYGRDLLIVYDRSDKYFEQGNPIVEFYDKRHNDCEFGRFASRYYANTLLSDAASLQKSGLSLNNSIPEWTMSAESMVKVFEWLKPLLESKPKRLWRRVKGRRSSG